MKRITILALALNLVFHVSAQPTITESNLPTIGMETIYKDFNAPNFTPGPSGANVTWDFSTLVQGSDVSYTYVDPATVTGHSNYPGSNICAVGAGDYRVFMDRQNTGLNHVGSIYTANSNVIYTDHQEMLKLPITYTDAFNENMVGTVDWGSIVVDRHGTTEIHADGYGTLILPNETLTEVLRVKTVDVINDSLNGAWQGLYEYTTYTWYHESRIDGILTWRIRKTVSSSSTAIDTTGEFFNQLVTNLDVVSNKGHQVKLYPNPCRHEFNVESMATDINKVIIYDLSGNTVISKTLKVQQGKLKEVVDVRSLENGVYNVVLSGPNKAISRRLVVRAGLYP